MRTLSLLYLFLVLSATGVHAQGWVEPLPGRGGVVRTRAEVTVTVRNRIAHVEVEEWFANRGGQMAEGDYLYPLPSDAVFRNFSLFQGDQELRGETMDAEKARAIYEEIVRRRKDPALIELVGHGLVRARVFPINPGESRKIIMRYTQVLKRSGDAYQLRYAAPGRVESGQPQPRDEGTRRVPDGGPLSFRVIVEDAGSYLEPFSPTHEVRASRQDDRWTVRPVSSLSGGFTLMLPVAGTGVGLSLLTHKPSGEAGYFMLSLTPEQARAVRVPRDVSVVLDVSGSMAGNKMEQAKLALRQLISSLDAGDRFRLIKFNGSVSTFRAGWTKATAGDLSGARGWVDQLVAEGGTNISGALEEAFRLDSPEDRLGIVLFITDGLPSVGERDPERIAALAERARGRSRVFAFGVGYDVNTYLLDRLASAGRGSTQYVSPDQDVEQVVGALSAKIRHPVLTDLELAHTPVRITEVYPVRLPDLFSGEELVIFGRYAASEMARGEIVLTGRRGGRNERYASSVEFPSHDGDNEFIARLWAARKVGVLAQRLMLEGRDPELLQELRETALRYGVLTEHTSYLVLEPEAMVAQDGRPRLQDAVMAPPPTAPRDFVGHGAVAGAASAQARREVRNSAELDRVNKSAAEESLAATGRSGSAARTVAGRAFRLVNGTWTDTRAKRDVRVVRIEAFSAAYFALLRRLPELEPYWKAFAQVEVAGERVAVRVAPGGVSTLSEQALAQLVGEFRARMASKR